MSVVLEGRREALSGRAAVFFLSGSLLAAAAFAAVLLRFPPGEYGFYPVCPIYRYLHVECPGCGATRALAALLRGHPREAIRDNALFVLGVLPGAIVYGCVWLVRARKQPRGTANLWPRLPAPALYAVVALALGFAVVRNLVR